MKKERVLGMMMGSVMSVGAFNVAAHTEGEGAGWEFHPGHWVSANINLATDYVFRGNSQTDGNPAVQGGFDYEYKPYNLYAGIWASNVDSNRAQYLLTDRLSGLHALTSEGLLNQFNENGIDTSYEYVYKNVDVTVLNAPGYEGASMETDFYLGWRPEVETDYGTWDFDVGFMRYQYFGTDNDDLHTNEFYAGIGYDYDDYFRLGYKAHYSDRYFGADTDVWYHLFNLDVPLDRMIDYPGFTFHANYGITNYSDDLAPAAGLPIANVSTDVYDVRFEDFNYDHYGIGVKYESQGWITDLSWTDRSDKTNCYRPFKCESKAVFQVGKTF